jgi:hypothetical protein
VSLGIRRLTAGSRLKARVPIGEVTRTEERAAIVVVVIEAVRTGVTADGSPARHLQEAIVVIEEREKIEMTGATVATAGLATPALHLLMNDPNLLVTALLRRKVDPLHRFQKNLTNLKNGECHAV